MATKKYSGYEVKNVSINENEISYFDDEVEEMFEKREIRNKSKKSIEKNTKRIMRNR